MKKVLFYLVFVSCALTSSIANASLVNKELLEDYAKPSLYMDVKISPKGTYLASTSRGDDGVVFLTVLNIKKQKVESITKGRGKESVTSFNWLNDKRLVLTMAREVGAFGTPSPTGELIGMDADGSNSTILTGWRAESGDRRFSTIIDILPDDPEAILVASFQLGASEPFLDIYKMKVTNGRKSAQGRMPLRAYAGSGVQVYTNQKGEPLAVSGSDPNRNNITTLMARNKNTGEWEVVTESEQFGKTFTPLVFLEDDETMVGLSTLETSTDALATYNIVTKEHTVLAAHDVVDIDPILYQENGKVKEVFGADFVYEDIGSFFFDNVENTQQQRLIASLKNSFKGQSVSVTSATRDNSKSVIRVEGANQPLKFFLFDAKKRQLVNLAQSRPWFSDKREIPQTQMIQFKARDGLEISAVLTLPVGKKENLPLILLPHGGPHGIQNNITSFIGDPELRDAKVLAEHGYAVIQPNFRGSGGYGIDFLRAGFRNWGTTMIDDMTDAVMHLVDQGIADKDKMCVYGASYGGYAALQSVIREPDLYKCAIGFVGVYDLDMMFEKGDIPQRQSGINYLNLIMPEEGEKRDFQSPVKNVDKIKVPIFIIQGEEDQRVPKEHAFALRDELEARNMPYEWMMKEGEGHGFFIPANNIERWTEMLEFLDKHIEK